ncbi:MAG: putative sulfate exporter family transporter [Phycisphaerales bacterium]|nr:putative sulfate exporter family transporter [Phycisphaerales bacterium]
MDQATAQIGKPGGREMIAPVAFVLGLAFCLTPWASPATALGLGVVLALAGLTAWPGPGKKVSRFLIQVCVVLLGFRMDFAQLMGTAKDGLLFAAGTIIGTMALGYIVGKFLRTGREISLLISSGTAVCGGSAIAAVGSAIAADGTAMAVATGTVFILNAIALYLFPVIGHALHLSPEQFGTWAGVAIHDVSSVVGAAKSYHVAGETGATALDVANVVKLSRVLWIIPLVFYARWMVKERPETAPVEAAPAPARRGLSIPIPWFIALFLIASLLRSVIPEIRPWADTIKTIAGYGFQLALFLIGAGLSMKAIRAVGWRAMAQGITLWIVISISGLLVVMATVD